MNQLLSFRDDGTQYAWDSTSLSSFVTCPRKYYLSMLQGWTSEHKSVHLIFGGHYASALEHFHKHRAAGVEYDDALRLVVKEALENTWDREANAPQDWLHSSKTRDTLIRSIVWYLEHFKDDPMQTVILSNGQAAVEYSFSVDLTDEYIYCGHIDRLVTYGDNADVYVQDQKTSGAQITPRYFEGYSPDYQMTGYTWAGQIIFAMPVKGVVIDAAYIAVGFTAFGRQPVTRSEKQLEEFRSEVLHYIGQAKRCHESGYYPMNRTACGNYGGCEFKRICSAVPGVRDNLLQGSFKKRDRWDPIKRR
jgi:CRISPR/Cas system-associated exonuclease Cas4 (RecB family)